MKTKKTRVFDPTGQEQDRRHVYKKSKTTHDSEQPKLRVTQSNRTGAALVDRSATVNNQGGGDRNEFGAETNERKPRPLHRNRPQAPMKTESENITRQEILEQSTP
jgi:hypothetical protein